MITLVHVSGSAPRDAGTRMLVTPDAISGTVGGGNLEMQLIDQARRMLAKDKPDVLQQDYPLGPLLAQCCGGHVRVLIERLGPGSRGWLGSCDQQERAGKPYILHAVVDNGRVKRSVFPEPKIRAPGAWISRGREHVEAKGPWTLLTEHIKPVSAELIVFGAGHVGKAIAHIATTLPFHFRWFDNRPEAAAEDVLIAIRKDPVKVVAEASPGAYFLVLTHSHELDYALVSAILKRGDARYCGLIGSATKRARFVSRLAKDGADASGLTCPIGAGAIRSKAPAAIAVAAAAELLVLLETPVPAKVQA
ncbi:MAG TPA: xanthine dehydrogenase accessory protein XdhC [Hyphomonadaceae bacterium]|nr:xanthine dehydrogenase accessory protein XdhC [Hyphomonadaceae bacterium]